ncbi:MAG: pyruvate, water dikinase regulatory protein [Moraxellaceae bacterium]|nr:pyruvate, water dikinase regulatory protein [Moraxellaceae bacterium]MDZ4297910.1 pyruvate, water dikinase regulatory protein [Moraxellaceae bacterium]MDZ4387237.1 pyruvate, water dikinase regulatory protein [Moraxellaceae bacterium]
MTDNLKRTVFFVSDGTGITAETLGRSLLAQFESMTFEEVTVPFVDTLEKAAHLVREINKVAEIEGSRPIIIDTIVDKSIRSEIAQANGYMMDVFETFVDRLQDELCSKPVNAVGKSHSIINNATYNVRIDAVHFALDNDDGAKTRYYDKADLILVGVSRSGKTPTSLYMALQFGIFVANYPLTEDDFDDLRLPASLREHKRKIFGLTIDPQRLSAIRNERRANSTYASLNQCQMETRAVEAMFNREGVPYIQTTHLSIEEISTRIMAQVGIKRRAV